METTYLLLMVAFLQVVAAASPGPNFILISGYSISHSAKHALLAAIGILIGILIWSSLAVLGLGALILTSPAAYRVVQFLGASYLFWLGANMFASSVGKKDPASLAPCRTASASPLIKGFLVNIGNPKTVAYYSSLFAVLIPPDAGGWLLLAIIVVDALACGIWWAVIAIAFDAEPVKNFFIRFRKQIDRVFGATLVGLGLKLALE